MIKQVIPIENWFAIYAVSNKPIKLDKVRVMCLVVVCQDDGEEYVTAIDGTCEESEFCPGAGNFLGYCHEKDCETDRAYFETLAERFFKTLKESMRKKGGGGD